MAREDGTPLTTMPVIGLRPASDADWPTIHRWLRQDEVQRWWGSLAAAEAEVLAALRSSMGLCSIIEVGGVAVGYAQAQEATVLGQGLPAALTAGTFRVDAFIGEAAYRRRGIAMAALRLVAAEVFATTLVLGVIVVVALRHEAAIRAYEKAGFRWVRVIDDPLFGPSWLMRLER
jgi:ribosomal protein S18 acetylase RimI-like enzyme